MRRSINVLKTGRHKVNIQFYTGFFYNENFAVWPCRFLKDLEDRIFVKQLFSDICDIIHYHAQHNFPAYIDYVRNQIYQEKIYTTLM